MLKTVKLFSKKMFKKELEEDKKRVKKFKKNNKMRVFKIMKTFSVFLSAIIMYTLVEKNRRVLRGKNKLI